MDRRIFSFNMLAFPVAMSAARLRASEDAPASAQTSIWDQSRKIRFILRDALEHPFYWWPRTLLTYPIEFREAVDLDRLVLTNIDSGDRVPIQFSDLKRDQDGLQTATLNFLADLPSGGHREFVLSTGDSQSAMQPQVRELREGNTIVLGSGIMRVRIPASQSVVGDAPGPVMQVSRGEKWIGTSVLSFQGDQVKQITTNRIASGPLFIAYEIDYETAGGSRYMARIQCNAGFEFVRLQENMEGIRPGAGGILTTNWIGFDPTHRQSPNHPFPLPEQILSYDDYAWEKIDEPWRKGDVKFGASRPIYPAVLPAGQLPVILGIYEPAPGNNTIGTWANFWDQRSGDALGVFIDDVPYWQDHEYAYEVESQALEVRTYYEDGKLLWRWPLVRGRRSTCIAFYDHVKDKEAMRQLEVDSQPVQKDGFTYQAPLSFTSHTLFLENRHGTLDLNRVKDWVLEYPDELRRPAVIFTDGSIKTAAQLERQVMTSPFVSTLPITGTRQMDGHGPIPGRSIVNFSPVPSRQIMGSWIDGFNRLSATMSERQRKRLTAMYLFIAYVLAGDDFMPVVPMLAGHPNYLADVKSAAPAMSFLFPDHPMAGTWADMWQKCVALNTRYNTRPSVKTWNADGGRWTEDLGTYVWAFARPSMRTDFLLRKYDGVDRFVTPQLAEMADWLVNSLSAPFDGETKEGFKSLLAADHGREWGVVGPGQGPRRVYPPIGAHSEQRIPPRSLWYLGTCLQRYAPMAAEHAMWASRPADQDAESQPGSWPPWDDVMYSLPENLGTNPHLRSRKHTGYGIVLRAAVGTPDELSVHLQQIDEGPNYRWGWAAEGGCGLVYFYAAGKAYSFNGPEDVGDRRDQDTDFCTNFGVFKDGEFRSIGQNVLSRPFYNLGAGQFAEIVPREAPSQYAAQEYVSRSILLAGHEYFVLYDAVLEQSIIHRLSWFVRRGSELPNIQLVRGFAENSETQRTDHQTDSLIGVWFDGVGDSMAVVSHRNDVHVEGTSFGCRVQVGDVRDLVFRHPQPVHFADGGMVFEGTVGLIRSAKDRIEFALFHGTRVGVPGITLSTVDADLGIGGSMVAGQAPCGEYYAPQTSSVTITLPSLSEKTVFYVDGEARTAQRVSGALAVGLPAGSHHWEVTDGLPVPVAPHVLRTENFAGGGRVVVAQVASATQYRFELSKDNGATWTTIRVENQPRIEVSGLDNGKKVHVRAVALNSMHESLPGPEYPLYVTDHAPSAPDGIQVELADGSATISWGEVLGTSEYRLYARTRSEKDFHVLYRGLERAFVDRRAGIKACNEIPGPSASTTNAEIVEYRVAAVNGNGESAMSRSADTDPASWRNWDPRPGEGFRRVYSYSPDSPPSSSPFPRYYPE